MERTQVLIAGGGPVGCVAAYALAQAGIDSILLEAMPDCPEDMRASTLHPPTLDMLDQLGLLPQLESVGLRAPRYQYRNRKTGRRIEFDLSELADVTPHPYRLQCEQFKITRLITGLLEADRPGSVRFGHRLVGYAQDASGVEGYVETPTAIQRISADFLIGADGANSIVRKWTGAEFDGFTYPERFLTLSTNYPIEQHMPDLAEVNYVADDTEWCVLLRVPGLWRVLVPTDIDAPESELLSEANKDAVFGRLTGNGAEVQTQHRTLYRVHQRVAKGFAHGRVLLVGDAAHLNNPLGGFGMNSGIHDAWNLVAKLREILIDGAEPDAALARYDRQRRTIAHNFVQEQTIANKKMMEANGSAGARHEDDLAAIVADEGRRRAYLLRQSMIDSLAQEAAIN